MLSGTLTIQIDRLMDDVYFKQVSDAFKYGGYPKFLPALRQLPQVGYVVAAGRQTPIKYAHARVDGKPGIVLGTDQPLFFLGGAAPDAKPRAGYEMGIIELQLDATGDGHGTIAAAARVRRGNDGGVIVEDYASTPIKLLVRPAR
jgi:hypothetical protein